MLNKYTKNASRAQEAKARNAKHAQVMYNASIFHRMRKFVIKHRQKRKYTKKTEELSSYSFSKTITGMLPLLVMIIALMTTLVISTTFRTTLSHIQFQLTFQLPTFTLENPLVFFQALALEVIQIGKTLWSSVIATMSTITQGVITTAIAIGQSITLLNPAPVFQLLANGLVMFGNVFTSIFHYIVAFLTGFILGSIHILGDIFLFVTNSMSIGISFIGGIIDTIGQMIISCLNAVITLIVNMVTFILNGITTIVSITAKTCVDLFILAWNGLVIAISTMGHFISFVALTVFKFVIIALQTLWMLLTFIVHSIITAFVNTFTAIFHIFEIPFKILYAFWLQMKPYVDIFGNHVAMAGADFNNGFASFGKVGALLSTPK